VIPFSALDWARIQVFDENGKFMHAWPNMRRPYSLLMSKDQHLWVTTRPKKGADPAIRQRAVAYGSVGPLRLLGRWALLRL
jgi:hypothetical protein